MQRYGNSRTEVNLTVQVLTSLAHSATAWLLLVQDRVNLAINAARAAKRLWEEGWAAVARACAMQSLLAWKAELQKHENHPTHSLTHHPGLCKTSNCTILWPTCWLAC
jgi:hypothetical protein